MRFRSLGAVVAVSLALGCDDGSRPLSPTAAERPQPLISDGANSGNPHFFFLPPVLAKPATTGVFNGGWRPVVEICTLDATTVSALATASCVATIHTFTFPQISVSPAEELYKVNWDTRADGLSTSLYYRVTVKVAGQTLGFFDVDPVSNSSIKNAQTGQYITLIDGRTLPIKFRIEVGALDYTAVAGDFAEQVVTNDGADAGGTGTNVETNTGYAAAFFPDGWLPAGYSQVIVTIVRNPVGPTNDCHQAPGLLQFEGCYQFETYPDVGTFAQPVRVELCSELDDDSRYDAQLLFKSDVGEPLTELPGAAAQIIDCLGFQGTGVIALREGGLLDRAGEGLWQLAGRLGHLLSPKSAYAIDLGRGGTTLSFSRFGWGIPMEIEILGGDGQSGPTGLALEGQPSVLVTGSHYHPSSTAGPIALDNIPVAFAVTSGGGSVSSANAWTDDGEASVFWTLGSLVGTQTLTASITTVEHEEGVETPPRRWTQVTKSVTFTATGLTSATPTITSLVLSTPTIVLEGTGGTYTTTLYNPGSTISDVVLQGWIEQGTARRAAGGKLISCASVPLGNLPTGTCTDGFSFSANNTSSAGTGTLVPGPATFVLELKRQPGTGPEVIYDTEAAPITLGAP